MSTGSEGTESENGNSSESVGEEVIQRAKELKQGLSEGALRERIEELESDLEAYRTRYDHDSPEETDQFADIDDEVIREWEMTRADKAVATLALRLSEAVSTIEMDRLETATAERDDWSQSPPSDAGEALFGDGPENDIADMPDLGRSPLPDRGSDNESD
jgi:hypothetical protein